MNWKENFTTKRLARGFEYYKDGNVLEIMKTASGYKAEVEGSGYDAYHVDIKIEKGVIKDMDCTCIYGQEMGYCKHMAAVLYAIDEKNNIEEDISLKDNDEYLSANECFQLVDSVSERKDVKYKLKLMKGNDLCNNLKHRLECIIRKYAGMTGEIETYDLYSFSEKILNFLEQDVYQVDDMYWKNKTECICKVLDKLNELNLDESEEDVWIMFNTCYEMLGTILSKDASRLCWMKDTMNPIYYREFVETINV